MSAHNIYPLKRFKSEQPPSADVPPAQSMT
jgi:hypothetical protein